MQCSAKVQICLAVIRVELTFVGKLNCLYKT